jgi:hypothetical protein
LGGAIHREARKPSRAGRRPQFESLEGRQLLAASLAPIANVSVPATLGNQLPLDGSGANAPQTFTVRSSNPDIETTVAQGQFLTLLVYHTPADANDVAIGSPTSPVLITFQLFQDLTPQTYNTIVSFVQQGFYNGITFHRVANTFLP